MKKVIRLTESQLIKIVNKVIKEAGFEAPSETGDERIGSETLEETYNLFGVNVKLIIDEDEKVTKIVPFGSRNLYDYGKHLNQDKLDKIFTDKLIKLLRLSGVDYTTSDFYSKASWGIDIDQLNDAIKKDKIKININGNNLDLRPGNYFGDRFRFFK